LTGIIRKMKSMTSYNKWDIVLVKFPFTSSTTTKKRPALILSTNKIDDTESCTILMITSDIKSKNYGDYTIKNWREAGLPKPAVVKMRFATIPTSIIDKKISQLDKKDIDYIIDKIIEFLTH